ncbi:MAG: hypothetical protein WBV85_04420 [Solirubrobacteraceae bacterium]
MPSSGPHFPVRFDPAPWKDDLARSTPAGRTAAEKTCTTYESDGVLRSHLKPSEREAQDGTNLPDCAKVYLPQPDGRFGMIFSVDGEANKPALLFLAFGVRHHPPSSHALTVYEIAHSRLHDHAKSEGTGSIG